MRVEVLSDADGIEEEWWALWRLDPGATPFQSPAWLIPWRRQFRDGDTMIVALRDRRRLVALVPLFRHEGRLLPWGAGTSDWLDGVFDPGLDPAALARGLGQLRLPVELFQLHAGSPLLRMPVPEGWRDEAGAAESCAVLGLPARLGTKMAQNLRYYRRRAARAGLAEPQRGSVADSDTLMALHTQRWTQRGEAGIFADPRVIAWQREALPALDAAGLLRLHVLRNGSAPIAALCVLAAKRRSFYYIGGFDPDFAALGPGTILVGHAIENAEREGHHSFDFLRGREPYKYRWGAADHSTHARRLAPPEWKADI